MYIYIVTTIDAELLVACMLPAPCRGWRAGLECGLACRASNSPACSSLARLVEIIIIVVITTISIMTTTFHFPAHLHSHFRSNLTLPPQPAARTPEPQPDPTPTTTPDTPQQAI